nr:unnamed protein product [Spirometra erinaceieuropaei]
MASPLRMIPKAATIDWRPRGEYMTLNNVTDPDRYPVLHFRDFVSALFGRSVFSKIDLVRAFHQIPIVPEDVSKTAVTTPFGLFEFLHMMLGLCNASRTFRGRFTRWSEAVYLPDAITTVVKVFLGRWVAIFGTPSTITTDRGAQFESNLFQSLLPLGCSCIRTTVRHPAANGMIERFHRHLNASLSAADDLETRTDHLPLIIFGIRPSLKSDLGCSAAELMLSNAIRLPCQMISSTPRDLATFSHIYLRCDRVRWPLERSYDAPHRVISRGTKNFLTQREVREEVMSVNRLNAAVRTLLWMSPVPLYPYPTFPIPYPSVPYTPSSYMFVSPNCN